MFGVDDAIIAGIVASMAGAAVQANSASRAASRQQAAAVQAQQRQLQAQNEATQVASRKASDFDPAERQAAQDAIREQLTAGLEKQVTGPQITAQGVQVGSTIPEGAETGDYSVAKAKAQAKSAASLHALAGLMGRIGSATQLRQNEAVGIGDTAGEIGRIGTGASNIFQADQAGIAAAGAPDFLSQIASAGLKGYGTGQIAGAGLASKTVPGLTTGDFARMDRGVNVL